MRNSLPHERARRGREWAAVLLAVCIPIAACASHRPLGAPKRLMSKNVKPSWRDAITAETSWGGQSCDSPGPLVGHATGWHSIAFRVRVLAKDASGAPSPVAGATIWIREPFWDEVRSIAMEPGAARVTLWRSLVDSEYRELPYDPDGFMPLALELKVSIYPRCENGRVVESVGTYPQLMSVSAPGCRPEMLEIDASWSGDRTIELACGD